MGVKGESALHKFLEPSTQGPIDYMHQTCEGTFKNDMLHCFDYGSKEKYRKFKTYCGGAKLLAEIDSALRKIRWPHDFGRKVPSLHYLKQFKAYELKNLLLYAFVPGKTHSFSLLLTVCTYYFSVIGSKKFLTNNPAFQERDTLWHYFAISNEIIRRLTSDFIDYNSLEYIEKMIDVMNCLVPTLFGLSHATMNCHLTTHFIKYVRLFGPLHGYSAFNFEGFNGKFMRLTNTTKGSLMQIAKRFAQIKTSLIWNESFIENKADNEIIKTLDAGKTYELNNLEQSAIYNICPNLQLQTCRAYDRLKVNDVVYHSTSYKASSIKCCSYNCILSLNNVNQFARAEKFINVDGDYLLMYRKYERINGLLDGMEPPNNNLLLPFFNERAYGNFFTYVTLAPAIHCCYANALVQKAITIPDGEKLIITPVNNKYEHN
jgi:hypothetical protein